MSVVQSTTLSEQETIINIMVRVFHWSIIVLFVLLFVTGDNNDGSDALHIVSGHLLVSFLLARMLWGMIGNENARWKNYLYYPKQIISYLAQLFDTTLVHKFQLHNPAGSSMILLMMSVLSITAITGLLLESLFEFSGVLLFATAYFNNDSALLIREVHGILAYLMLFAIGFHVAGVLYSSFLYKENMSLMMMTGKVSFLKKEEV